MHVGKVSCRLTLDESEGVVLCNRNAGPHQVHKPRTVISPIDADRPLQKQVAGSAWSGHPPNESLHSSAFGSTLSTRRKGRLFTKRNEITRLSSELRCPHAYRIQRGAGLPVIAWSFLLLHRAQQMEIPHGLAKQQAVDTLATLHHDLEYLMIRPRTTSGLVRNST
jgi:hypothetical protein